MKLLRARITNRVNAIKYNFDRLISSTITFFTYYWPMNDHNSTHSNSHRKAPSGFQFLLTRLFNKVHSFRTQRTIILGDYENISYITMELRNSLKKV